MWTHVCMTSEFSFFLFCHHSSQFFWPLVHGSGYFTPSSFSGTNQISEFLGWGLERCLPINPSHFITKINTFAFSSFSPQILLSIFFMPGMEPDGGAIGWMKLAKALAFRGLTEIYSLNLNPTGKPSWLHFRMSASSLPYIHGTRHSCCWGNIISCIIFNWWSWYVSEINWSAKWDEVENRLGINQWRK